MDRRCGLAFLVLWMMAGDVLGDCPFHKCSKYFSTSLVCTAGNLSSHVQACQYNKSYTKFSDIVLKNANIASLEPGVFWQMTQLKSLYLSNNSLETLDYRVFMKQGNLRHLDLRYNRIRSLDDRVFQNLKRLHTLLLDGNALTTLSVEVLEPLHHLMTLGLVGNPFDCDCSFVTSLKWCARKGLQTGVTCSEQHLRACADKYHAEVTAHWNEMVTAHRNKMVAPSTTEKEDVGSREARWRWILVVIIASVTSSVVFLLSIIGFLIWWRKHKQERGLVYGHEGNVVQPLYPDKQKTAEQ